MMNRLLAMLDGEDIGVLTSVTSLVLGVVSQKIEGYEDAPPKCINLLAKVHTITIYHIIY
jgi:hypothetical protein